MRDLIRSVLKGYQLILVPRARVTLFEQKQSRTQSPQASWSAGGTRRDSGIMEPAVKGSYFCYSEQPRTVNQKNHILPLPQSLSWRRPLTRKPEDSGYKIGAERASCVARSAGKG